MVPREGLILQPGQGLMRDRLMLGDALFVLDALAPAGHLPDATVIAARRDEIWRLSGKELYAGLVVANARAAETAHRLCLTGREVAAIQPQLV